MKSTLRTLAMLCMAFVALLFPACASTGPGGGEAAIARSVVQVAAMQQLGKANTHTAWEKKHTQLTALSVALEAVNAKGVSAEALRPVLAAQLANKPYALLLLDLALAHVQPPGTTGVNNALLAAVTAGLQAAVDLPEPEWPSGK